MLKLIISETCPYCQKVIKFLDENNIEYLKMDVAEPANLRILLDKGGKSQVPFLIDEAHDLCMYESDDIINYITKLKR